MAIGRLVGIYSDLRYQVVRYPDGRKVDFVTSVFVCRVRGGHLQGSGEGTAWEWFTAGEWPDPLLPYAAHWLEDTLAGHTDAVVR